MNTNLFEIEMLYFDYCVGEFRDNSRSSVTVAHKFYDSRCKNVGIRVPFSRTISQFLPSQVTWSGKDEACPHFRTRQ